MIKYFKKAINNSNYYYFFFYGTVNNLKLKIYSRTLGQKG